MFLFHSLHPGLFRRRQARNVFAFAALSFLFTALLFTGCGDGGGNTVSTGSKVSLNGTWVSEYGEKWIINLNNNSLDCPSEDYPDYAYAGTISEVEYFNNNNTTGIIFIELASTGASFAKSGEGNFTGIYFTNLTNTTVEISTAADTSYATPVRETLAKAKELLNVDSVSTYFAITSACEKQ